MGRWFRERELAFAMGITESAHYVSSVLGKGLPAKLAHWVDMMSPFGLVLVRLCSRLFFRCFTLFALGRRWNASSESAQRIIL